MIFRRKPSESEILKQEILNQIASISLSEISALSDLNSNLTFQDLGIEFSLHIDNNQISLELRAGFPLEYIEATGSNVLLERIQQIVPSYQVQLNFIGNIKPHRTQLLSKGLRGVKNTIAIASGKGGVGKSTITINLAIALSRLGAKVGILDADIYGPSIPVMLGKTEPIKQEENGILPVFAHGVYAMSIGYLVENEQALIWRGPMLAKSLIQLINLTLWDELDYLLIDLPPGTGDIQLSLVQKIPLTGAIIVTTPQTVATSDAQKAIKMFQKTNIDILGLIENMAFYHCKQCRHEDSIFGSLGGQRLSESFKIPLLGQLPLDSQIQEDCDKGSPTASRIGNELSSLWMAIALKTSIELAQRPLNYADKFPNIVVE